MISRDAIPLHLFLILGLFPFPKLALEAGLGISSAADGTVACSSIEDPGLTTPCSSTGSDSGRREVGARASAGSATEGPAILPERVTWAWGPEKKVATGCNLGLWLITSKYGYEAAVTSTSSVPVPVLGRHNYYNLVLIRKSAK